MKNAEDEQTQNQVQKSNHPKHSEWRILIFVFILVVSGFVFIKFLYPSSTILTRTKTSESSTRLVNRMPDPWGGIVPENLNIIIWHSFTHEQESTLKTIITEFNQTNPYHISVKPEYQGGTEDIFNKMMMILNTADVPDLVVTELSQAATYQLRKGLVDLNPLVKHPVWGLRPEEQRDFIRGFWTQDVYPNFDNARLGFPLYRSMDMMYFNLDWLKELGYDFPPVTPEQFKIITCKASSQAFSKQAVEGNSMGYEMSMDSSEMTSWTFAFGGDFYDYKAAKFNFNNTATSDAMVFIQDLIKNKCATIGTNETNEMVEFGNGRLLFSEKSSSMISLYDSAVRKGSNHAWGVSPIPHLTPEPIPYISGPSLSIPRADPRRNLAAWIFLKFMMSPENQALIAQENRAFPARVSSASFMKEYFDQNPKYKPAFDLLNMASHEPSVPGYDEIRYEIKKALLMIARGENVRVTLEELDSRSNQIVDKQLAKMKY